MKKKRKGRTPTLFDFIDYDILKYLIVYKKLSINELREKLDLTHANLITHMIRLKPYLNRERDKHKIYLSLNEKGIKLYELMGLADISETIKQLEKQYNKRTELVLSALNDDKPRKKAKEIQLNKKK